MAFFFKIGNFFMKLILRSPLHGMLSKNTMLLTVTGRKSGRQYTLPVNYVQDAGYLLVVSQPGRTWWKNLRGGAPIRLRLRGEDRTGQAELVGEEDATRAGDIRTYFQTLLPGRYSEDKIAEQIEQVVLIRIGLEPSAV